MVKIWYVEIWGQTLGRIVHLRCESYTPFYTSDIHYTTQSLRLQSFYNLIQNAQRWTFNFIFSLSPFFSPILQTIEKVRRTKNVVSLELIIWFCLFFFYLISLCRKNFPLDSCSCPCSSRGIWEVVPFCSLYPNHLQLPRVFVLNVRPALLDTFIRSGLFSTDAINNTVDWIAADAESVTNNRRNHDNNFYCVSNCLRPIEKEKKKHLFTQNY